MGDGWERAVVSYPAPRANDYGNGNGVATAFAPDAQNCPP